MIFKYIVCSIYVLLSFQACLGVPTGVELLANLNSSDFVYDLGKAVPTKNGNNTIRQLSVTQFPTLAFTGISYTLFELAPCGINLPHLHPRASELLYVIMSI
jgi:oxalate decarboxylase/phosphoglucose isomerase-like protein (cupin superfamily)